MGHRRDQHDGVVAAGQHALEDALGGGDLLGDMGQHLGMDLTRARAGLAATPLDRVAVHEAQFLAGAVHTFHRRRAAVLFARLQPTQVHAERFVRHHASSAVSRA